MEAQLEQSLNQLVKEVDLLAQQVGKMGEILTELALLNERSNTIEKDVDGYGQRMSKYEDRMKVIEIKSAVQANSGAALNRWVERIIVFIVLTALGSYSFFKN